MHLYLSRFVCWVHYCSKLCQSSPWRREASHFQNCQIQTASLSQKNQSLIKPLLKNSFPTIFQGPGPVEAPFHFSRFVCWVHYCSKLCQSSPWKPEGKQAISKIAKFKLQAFPKRTNPLLNPLLKNSFSTIFQGPGPGEAHFTLVGLFAGFTIAASCARAAPGSPEGKQAISKIAKFKLQAFPKRTNPLLNPY